MPFPPIQPARIDFDATAAPRAPDFGDVYHPSAGALAQARHVFLGGNGLPGRWQRQPRFTILETGFGLGNNFLATWAAWRAAPARCERLVFVSIEKHPPRRNDLERAHAADPAELQSLAAELLAAWPPLTPDIHTLDFDGGRVRLLLVLADIADALPALVLQADAIYLDGFAPARNPAMWDAHRLMRLARLAAPGATVATWSVAREVRDSLASAGFELERAPGFAGKREMSIGRFAPRFIPPLPPGRRSAGRVQRIAVVGAGLAGAGVARALAREGIAVDVFDAEPQPAQHASGNPAGLFHGVLHRGDGPHARWLRAAARRTQQVLAPLIERGEVPGRFGLLRGETQASLDEMRRLLAEQACPADWIEAVEHAGRRWWHYPGGGWADPRAVVRAWLTGDGITTHCGSPVHALHETPDGWFLLDARGDPLQEADAVVLANAADAARLAGADWPLQRVRGQVSLVEAAAAPLLPLALADSGYVLQLPDGRLVCGATSQPDDEDPRVRADDHGRNLAALQRLTGWAAPPGAVLEGRVGWRLQAPDRLPLLGPVPRPTAADTEQPRRVERRPGLWLATAYGSRGLTHAALAGELLAAWITGAPLPLPTALVDALDVARFAARVNRRSAS